MDSITLYARTQFVSCEDGLSATNPEFAQLPPITLDEIRELLLKAAVECKYEIKVDEIQYKDEQVLLLEGYDIYGRLGDITISWAKPKYIKSTVQYIASKITRDIRDSLAAPEVPWQ